eukprot:scaffold3134_cov414-Prasinococcus_capsulatus_cf.AAC.5
MDPTSERAPSSSRTRYCRTSRGGELKCPFGVYSTDGCTPCKSSTAPNTVSLTTSIVMDSKAQSVTGKLARVGVSSSRSTYKAVFVTIGSLFWAPDLK